MSSNEEVVRKIMEKKELSSLDPTIVKDALVAYLRVNGLRVEALSTAQLKIIIKDVRASLRKRVGRFQASAKDRQELLDQNKISELLDTHSSTKERAVFYPKLREIINKMGVKSILDLGCGINPIAIAGPGIRYHAVDINLSDLGLVESFFQKNKIDGKVSVCDLTKIERCELPEADLVLILKVFDILGKEEFKIAKKVLETIKFKHLIVSFSTRTLSGKPMNRPRRVWFEKLLDSLCYKFEIVSADNEVFYLI